MYCTKCGLESNDVAKFCTSCGSSLSSPSLSIKPASQNIFEYAGFWRRFAAALIDGILLSIIRSITSVIITNEIINVILNSIISIIYAAVMLSSSYQATIGKLALSIKVIGLDGNRITFVKAAIRELSKIISALILLIGYIMVVFTKKKQALHDIIAGTVVIKKELSPVEERPISISNVDTPKIEVLTAETKTRDKAIYEGFEKLKRIRLYKDKINEIGIRGQLEELCNIADNIMVSVEKNPEEVKVIRKFLTYYLDAVIHILEKYTEIISLDALSKEAKDLEAKVKNVLETVKIGFEKQLSKLFEDDVFDLEAEIKLLESTIKMD